MTVENSCRGRNRLTSGMPEPIRNPFSGALVFQTNEDPELLMAVTQLSQYCVHLYAEVEKYKAVMTTLVRDVIINNIASCQCLTTEDRRRISMSAYKVLEDLGKVADA